MRGSNHDFCKSETKLFLLEGLDTRLGVESIHEISFSARVILR
jgi:hypothetical protein